MTEAIYDRIGIGYGRYRQPDPRIAARIARALGPARTVVNVGAGTGSYEPVDRRVTAVEPSQEMIAQRTRRAPGTLVVRGVAEALPFADGSFDAALAILTLHHWSDWRSGLREMRRVARQRVVLFTWDPAHPGFWLTRDYFPEIPEIDRRIFPMIPEMSEVLGPLRVESVPVPYDCTDGFLGAYWRRPEQYLDNGARRAISSFDKIGGVEEGIARLAADLRDGSWRARHRDLLRRRRLDIGYRLLVAKVRRADAEADGAADGAARGRF